MMFFKRRKKHSEPYKAVFSVTIDTNREFRGDDHSNKMVRHHPDTLVPGGEYWFGKQEEYATYDDLKELAIDVLNKELLDECKRFIDIPILDIEIKSIYEGSIELFFTVLFGVISGVTGIKDLYDSIDFLQTLAEKKVEEAFSREIRRSF